jgi:hypothetical protein
MHPDELRRIYVLVRSLAVIAAAVMVAGGVAGTEAFFTGRGDADGSFTVALLGGIATGLVWRGSRWELGAGARSGIEATALAAERTMWIILGVSLGPLAAIAAFASAPEGLAVTLACAAMSVVLLYKGARSLWHARHYVSAVRGLA